MKLVILDRDGVINIDSDHYIKSVDEWLPLAESFTAIARLTQAGFTLVIATNQSGLGRGLFSESDLEAMHAKLLKGVNNAGGHIDAIYYCPHTPEDQCRCRKPASGLFETIRDHYGLADLHGVAVVGDSIRDLQAGLPLGCQPILVRTGKGLNSEKALATIESLATSTLVFDDLNAAASHLIAQSD